jgi:hypothetical protein
MGCARPGLASATFFVLHDVTILNVSLADTLAVAGAILLVGGGIGLGVIRDG